MLRKTLDVIDYLNTNQLMILAALVLLVVPASLATVTRGWLSLDDVRQIAFFVACGGIAILWGLRCVDSLMWNHFVELRIRIVNHSSHPSSMGDRT